MLTITADSFTDIAYSSFFVAGFQDLAAKGKCRFKTRRGSPSIALKGGSQPFHAIMLMSIDHQNGHSYFCIDTTDQSDWEHGVNKQLLEQCDHYFKVNYRPEMVDTTHPSAQKIHPVPIFLPIRPRKISSLLPRFVPCRSAGWTSHKVFWCLRRLNTLPSLESLRDLRTIPQTRDVVFAVRYYGEQQHAKEEAARRRMIKGLRDLPGRNVLAGFVSKDAMPPDYEALRIPGFSLKEYMRALAGSRLCIYIRGLHDCLSFKLGQLLAMGKPIVGQHILNNRDFYSSRPGMTEQFAFETVDDILAAVDKRLDQPQTLETRSQQNSRLFDENLSPEIVCQTILDIVQALPQQ